MAWKVVLLLLLGLFLRGGEALSSGAGNRKHIARLSTPRDSIVDECSAVDNRLYQNSVIRAIVNCDWTRVPLVIQLANEACTLEIQHDVYEALWQEWQLDKQIYDPPKILALFEQLEHLSKVPETLKEKIYQAFVSRSAQLLSTPFHTDSHSAEFPQITKLLLHLQQSSEHYMRDILETLFDMVLATESTQTVAQRLSNFNGNLTQLTMANLQLLHRPEVQLNSSAHAALLDNLGQFVNEPNFKLELDNSLRQKVYSELHPDDGMPRSLKKVCLRSSNDDSLYLYVCAYDTYLCFGRRNNIINASFKVHRVYSEVSNRTEFAFQSTYRKNRYLEMVSATDSEIARNVVHNNHIYWWHIKQLEDSVVIYDAATSGRVICVADLSIGTRKHAVSRLAENFDAHREECTWIIEDCSDKYYVINY